MHPGSLVVPRGTGSGVSDGPAGARELQILSSFHAVSPAGSNPVNGIALPGRKFFSR